MTDFIDQFTAELEKGSEALEQAGYDVLGYQGDIISTDAGIRVYGETPEEVLNNTLAELHSDNQFSFHVNGDELFDMIQGNQDAGALIYRNIKGGVEIEEPRTQPEWADEPVLAFGTLVKYVPTHPNDHWQVNTLETQEPYTHEDAHEHAEEIITALEEHGLEAEKGYID